MSPSTSGYRLDSRAKITTSGCSYMAIKHHLRSHRGMVDNGRSDDLLTVMVLSLYYAGEKISRTASCIGGGRINLVVQIQIK